MRKPEDFYAGVLAAQPMGFWSPQSLVADALRHGVRVLPADINRSLAQATVEQWEDHQDADRSDQWGPLRPHPAAPSALDVHDDLAVRLGLAPLKGLGERAAQAIVTERRTHGPYRDLADLARRVSLSRSRLEALAVSGALDSLGTERRQALWLPGSSPMSMVDVVVPPTRDKGRGVSPRFRGPPSVPGPRPCRP